MSKTKYYAVANGRVPGIYSALDDYVQQTKGFPGAIAKAFSSVKKAESFMKTQQAKREKAGKFFVLEGMEELGVYVNKKQVKKAQKKHPDTICHKFPNLRDAENYIKFLNRMAAERALSPVTTAVAVETPVAKPKLRYYVVQDNQNSDICTSAQEAEAKYLGVKKCRFDTLEEAQEYLAMLKRAKPKAPPGQKAKGSSTQRYYVMEGRADSEILLSRAEARKKYPNVSKRQFKTYASAKNYLAQLNKQANNSTQRYYVIDGKADSEILLSKTESQKKNPNAPRRKFKTYEKAESYLAMLKAQADSIAKTSADGCNTSNPPSVSSTQRYYVIDGKADSEILLSKAEAQKKYPNAPRRKFMTREEAEMYLETLNTPSIEVIDNSQTEPSPPQHYYYVVQGMANSAIFESKKEIKAAYPNTVRLKFETKEEAVDYLEQLKNEASGQDNTNSTQSALPQQYFYVVKGSVNSGIYTSKKVIKKAHPNVAKCRFSTRKEAENYLARLRTLVDEAEADMRARKAKSLPLEVNHSSYSLEEIKNMSEDKLNTLSAMTKGVTYSFVDGSYMPNSNYITYGAISFCDGRCVKQVCRNENSHGTLPSNANIEAELEGAKLAIGQAVMNGSDKVVIYYDNKMIETAANEPKTDKTQIDYAEYVKKQRQFIDIKFCKVKAHSGVPMNTKIDKLIRLELS